MKFYDYYGTRPPKVNTVLTDDTCFVSQSECEANSLQYMLDRFGMNTLSSRLEDMRSKFGYADCTVNNNFAELQNKYVVAKNYFESLPSQIRRDFHDNAEEFYNSLSSNPDLAYKTGFISEEQYKLMLDVHKDNVKQEKVDLVEEKILSNNQITSDTQVKQEGNDV